MNPAPDSDLRSRSGPGGARLLGVVLLAGLCAAHALRYDFVADDTFIGLRYVRNLLDGEGLVFNPGDRVEGYTNFLWLLWIAAAGALGFDLLEAARALGMACGVLLVPLAVVAGARLQGRQSTTLARLVPGLLIAASAPLACWIPSGMETPGYALLVLAALAMGMRADPAPAFRLLTGLVLGLTAWMRPEGLLVGIVIVAFASSKERGARARLLTALPFVALVAAQLAFRRNTYGEWAPNTYYAKVGGGSVGTFLRGLEYLHVFLKQNGGAFLYLVPFVAGFWRRDRAWWLAATLLLALAGGVALVGGDGLPMFRFCGPLVPIWALLMGALVHDGLGVLEERTRRLASGARLLPACFLLALVVASQLGTSKRGRPYQLYTDQKRYELPEWTAVGHWLRENARPGESVACVPVGAIGYYSGLKVYDMVGLTDRHIAHLDVEIGEGWAGHEKRDGAYILEQRPTYLLVGNVQVDRNPALLSARQLARISLTQFASREGDLFGPVLERWYEPAVAQVGEELYLHYFRLRRDAGSRQDAGKGRGQ